MARSPSHQLGEAIGDILEAAIIRYLQPVVSQKGYYLDYKHPRPARGGKREVIGVDNKGNRHKLDIVVEKNGTEARFGTPKAFIEVAWRRYVKHSKNKVQEIAGAILPLVETYAKDMPFYACALAGEFTENALSQLRSQGFYVMHLDYAEICRLFESVGLYIRWEEETSAADLQGMADAINALDEAQMNQLYENFYRAFQDRLNAIAEALSEALDAEISDIIVVPIHGMDRALNSINNAAAFIMSYDEASYAPVLRYEITLRYNNGHEYTMKCSNKGEAVQFLNQYT